jgi:hypothetical protein
MHKIFVWGICQQYRCCRKLTMILASKFFEAYTPAPLESQEYLTFIHFKIGVGDEEIR